MRIACKHQFFVWLKIQNRTSVELKNFAFEEIECICKEIAS